MATDGFRSVVFDCDSTLVAIEGIDELAGAKIEEVRRLTDLAMEGAIALEEVYGRRLAIIDPVRAQVEAIGRAYVEALVADAREVVAALLWLGKEVRVISGGLRPPVEAVARVLGIEPGKVAAVDIMFEADGRYRDFERDSPLARSGGKPEVLARWELPRPALLVGDGATDLEGRSAVDCFAAFMGVAHRPAVAAGADVVLSAPTLAPVLALASSTDERERLARSEWAALLARGDALLSDPAA
ncbi:MAG: HAD-IB family phosphatase [Gemmatimonadetes bacterium]|nr:HAD-IB family phosphatase [Gemmatimonadota bacterium]